MKVIGLGHGEMLPSRPILVRGYICVWVRPRSKTKKNKIKKNKKQEINKKQKKKYAAWDVVLVRRQSEFGLWMRLDSGP